MRRFVMLGASLLLLLTLAPPVAAATHTTSYSVRGSGAWGSAVVYGDGRFEAGWIEIGDALTREDGGTTVFSYVLFEHLLELCDDDGCVQQYTQGLAENVAFEIDRKKLTTASVELDVPATRCTDDGTTVECVEVVVPVAVAWAGFGTVIRSHGTMTGGIAGVYQYTLNGAATERWAHVTGTIGGFDLGAADAIGALYTTRQAKREITLG